MSDNIPTDPIEINDEIERLLKETPLTTDRGRLFHLIKAAMSNQSGGGVPVAPEGYARGYNTGAMDSSLYPLPTDPSIETTQSVVHGDVWSLTPLLGDAPNIMSTGMYGVVNPQAFVYKDPNTNMATASYVGVSFDVNNTAKAYVFGQGGTAKLLHECKLGTSDADYTGSNAYLPVNGVHAEYESVVPLVANFKKIDASSFSVELFNVSGEVAESLGDAAVITVPSLEDRPVAFERTDAMIAYDYTNDRVFLNFTNNRTQTIAMWDIGVSPVVTNLYVSGSDRRGGVPMIKHCYSYNMTNSILVYSKSTSDSSYVGIAYRSSVDNYATETVLESAIPIDTYNPIAEIVQAISTDASSNYKHGIYTTLPYSDDSFRYWKIDDSGFTENHISLADLRAHPNYTNLKGCAIWMDENGMYGSTGTYLGLVNDQTHDMDIYSLETYLQGQLIPLGQQHFTDPAFGYPVVNHCDDYLVLSAKNDDQNISCFGVMETWNYWSTTVPKDVAIVNGVANGDSALWDQALASGFAVDDKIEENPIALGFAMQNPVNAVKAKVVDTSGGGSREYWLDYAVVPRDGGVMVLNYLQPVTIPSNAPVGSTWLFLGTDNPNSQYNNAAYYRIAQSGAVTAQLMDGSILPLGVVSPKHTRGKAASGLYTSALYVEKTGEDTFKSMPLI